MSYFSTAMARMELLKARTNSGDGLDTQNCYCLLACERAKYVVSSHEVRSHMVEGQDQTLITLDNRKICCPGTIVMTRPLSWLAGRRLRAILIHMLLIPSHPFCAGIHACVTSYVIGWTASLQDRCKALHLFVRYPGNPLCAQPRSSR